MALKHEAHELRQATDLLVAPLYSLEAERIPRHELTEDEMPPDVAYQIVHDELMLDGEGEGGSLWAMMFEASRLDEVVEQVVRSLEFSGLAKYAFGLAQLFNAFYHRFPILGEEDAGKKAWRAAGVAYVRDQLTRALDLMGIEIPQRM